MRAPLTLAAVAVAAAIAPVETTPAALVRALLEPSVRLVMYAGVYALARHAPAPVAMVAAAAAVIAESNVAALTARP